MTNYIEEARKAKNEAFEISEAVTGNVATWKELFDEEKSEIERDPMLSADGKRIKLEELQKRMGRSLLELAASEREKYQKAIVKAETQAKFALAEPLKKPHDLEVSLNEQAVRKLELDAMFESSGKLVQQLDEHVNAIKDPYFADQMLDKLPGLMAKLGHIESTDKTKLKRVYAALQDKAMTDSKREAKQLLGSLDGAFYTKLYKPLHEDVVKLRAGAQYSSYLNDPKVKLNVLDSK